MTSQYDKRDALIEVKSLGNGDFEVTRGSEIVAEGCAVREGDTISAAQICEWQRLGGSVEETST